MNCAECRDNLVAWIEGLLDQEESLACGTHLEGCEACRAECEAVSHLQQRLEARGHAASGVSIVQPVMRQVLQNQKEPERNWIMAKLFTRWGIGLSAVTGGAVIVLIVVLASLGGKANAAEILARGAKAVADLSSIHMQCKLRTLPNDNFSLIAPDQDFVAVELWKQFGDSPKWRIDKPGRLAVMDGESTMLYIKTSNTGMKVNRPSSSAFDTGWLHEMANVAQVLTSEVRALQAQKKSLKLAQEMGADGAAKSVVTVESKSNLPDGDYLKNAFFNTADTRREYVFDNQNDRLQTVKVYLISQAAEQVIFEVDRIDYDLPIDPAVFHPQLPENVAWAYEELPNLPDNQNYAAMTAEQAARTLFEAFERSDWNEVQKFWPMPFSDRYKFLGGLKIVSIGKSFTSMLYPGEFVPYEIKLSNGATKKHNLALRKDNNAGRWVFDGGL